MIALALTMQKWVENFAEEWVEYPFLAVPLMLTELLTLSLNGPLSAVQTKRKRKQRV